MKKLLQAGVVAFSLMLAVPVLAAAPNIEPAQPPVSGDVTIQAPENDNGYATSTDSATRQVDRGWGQGNVRGGFGGGMRRMHGGMMPYRSGFGGSRAARSSAPVRASGPMFVLHAIAGIITMLLLWTVMVLLIIVLYRKVTGKPTDARS